MQIPAYLEIHTDDVLLFILCCITAATYKVTNPNLDVERDLYESHRTWYYVFKYSRIVVFGMIFLTLYLAVIRAMKYHTKWMAAEMGEQ
jgi:hypothetical protein